MDAVEQTQVSAEEARALTEEVKQDASSLWVKVYSLYQRSVHVALGYDSWGAYWEAEFGQTRGRGEQLVRAGRVAQALMMAELPIPPNDLVARELIPVLRSEPDKLGEVWAGILKQESKPTARQVRSAVEPYRRTTTTSTTRKNTRLARNKVGHRVRDCHTLAEQAFSSLDEALATEPSKETVERWTADAQEAAGALAEIYKRLKDYG
jgi:uncharacterized protein YukE